MVKVGWMRKWLFELGLKINCVDFCCVSVMVVVLLEWLVIRCVVVEGYNWVIKLLFLFFRLGGVREVVRIFS